MNNTPKHQEWFPQKVIDAEDPFALLILNQPLGSNEEEFLKKSWNRVSFKTAVDGGGNELFKICQKDDGFLPDLVCGDFDSIRPDVMNYFKKKGVKVTHTYNQDETDFTKALRVTSEHIINNGVEVSFFVVITTNGTRLDHLIGNLQTLHLACDFVPVPIFMYGNHILTFLLTEGSHKIHVPECFSKCHVGIFPLGGECTDVTTTGLEWNLDHGKMSFSGLISICNKFDGSGEVTVITNSKLIWTMETKVVE